MVKTDIRLVSVQKVTKLETRVWFYQVSSSLNFSMKQQVLFLTVYHCLLHWAWNGPFCTLNVQFYKHDFASIKGHQT